MLLLVKFIKKKFAYFFNFLKRLNDYNNEDNTDLSSDKELELEPIIDETKRFNEDPRERLRTSLNNCSAWLIANNLVDKNDQVMIFGQLKHYINLKL